MDKRKVGIFGGSFNPPHIGHVMAVTFALSVGRFDQVIVVPTFAHAFNKELLDFKHRLAMCRLAMQPLSCWRQKNDDVSRCQVWVSDIERSLPTPSYMINTIERFFDELEDTDLRLILGDDCTAEKSKWHKWNKIERLAPPWVLPREEARLVPQVSSTHVRDCLGPPRWWQGLHDKVPGAVLDYIEEHKLWS